MIVDKVRYPQYYAQCVASVHNFEESYLAELKQHPAIKYIIFGTDICMVPIKRTSKMGLV